MQHSCSHHNAFCSMTWLTRMYLRTWQHQMTKIMQPSQCDLQPPTQETNGTMRTGKTTRCRTQRRNRLTSKRSQPQQPHTGGTFHRRLQPLYTEKHTVSCSGFLPNTSPMQHSCSHYNVQCVLQHHVHIHATITLRFASICSRTQRRNRLTSKRSKPQPPHTGGTFRRRLQRLYTEKRKVSCSGFLPNTGPMQHATFMQPSQCILQHDVANLHVSTHMATPDDKNHAAIPMRSATTDSRNEWNYAHRKNHSLQNTEEEPITLGTTAAATAPHRRYLSSPAAATLHGKTQGFVLRLPPQHKPHATCNIHAAITMHFAAWRG